MDHSDKGVERDAEVWRLYVEKAIRADKELIEGWEKGIDVLLVFVCVDHHLLKLILTHMI